MSSSPIQTLPYVCSNLPSTQDQGARCQALPFHQAHLNTDRVTSALAAILHIHVVDVCQTSVYLFIYLFK